MAANPVPSTDRLSDQADVMARSTSFLKVDADFSSQSAYLLDVSEVGGDSPPVGRKSPPCMKSAAIAGGVLRRTKIRPLNIVAPRQPVQCAESPRKSGGIITAFGKRRRVC